MKLFRLAWIFSCLLISDGFAIAQVKLLDMVSSSVEEYQNSREAIVYRFTLAEGDAVLVRAE